jgi:hypothetical protein
MPTERVEPCEGTMQTERTESADPTRDHGAFIGSAIGCAVILAMLIGLSLATANNRKLVQQLSQVSLTPVGERVVSN